MEVEIMKWLASFRILMVSFMLFAFIIVSLLVLCC